MTDREKIEEIVHDLDSLCQKTQRAWIKSDFPMSLLKLGEYAGLDHARLTLKSAFELGEFDDTK